MKTIVACVDFSDASDRVLAEARNLGDAMKARVHLIHVVEPDYTPIMLSPGAIAAPPTQTIDATAQLARLSMLAKSLIVQGLDVSMEVLEGPPIESILAEVKRVNAERIILGSHGHGALYELLVGSVTEGVLRHSPVPVLVVPMR